MILADFSSIFAAKDYSVIHFFSKLNFSAMYFFSPQKYLLEKKKFFLNVIFLIVHCGFMMNDLI
jgi:hypothetical protein